MTAKERQKWHSRSQRLNKAAADCRDAGYAPFLDGNEADWFFRAADDLERCANLIERHL